MDGYGKELHKGDTFNWNVYSDVAVQGTTLNEETTMPESKYQITQHSLTVTEFGNSVPYTGRLDDLSEHPVKEIIHKVLRRDAKKAFDIQAHGQFNLTKKVVQPDGGTSTTDIVVYDNGTATQTIVATAKLNKEHVKKIVDTMKEADVEPFINDDYYALGHPSTFRVLKDGLEAIFQYVDAGHQKIVHGETGRYDGVRFVEQTNIAKSGGGGAGAQWAFFFGADTVSEALCIPEEIRGKIPSDYGRSKGVAW